jgi:lysophospholipase L1-like esterase
MIRVLCLAFYLAAGGVNAATVTAPTRHAITLHLAGDSTLAEKRPEKRPETGWGEMLAARFQPDTVRISNHARNGRSTRTFIAEGRWQSLLEGVKSGDYVLIQFGHNDQSMDKPDRYTPEADYRANLDRFVTDVRLRGATPVLMTPVARRRFDAQGRLLDSHGAYPNLVRALAAERDVALIDMQRRSEAVLQEAGDEGSKTLFLWLQPALNANYPQGVQDNTHFSPAGAGRMADEFAVGLAGLDIPLARLLRSVPDP